MAMVTLLVACSPAPSASPPPATGALPSASAVAVASPAHSSVPSISPSDPPPTAPPATPDPRYLGSFEIFPASPLPDFDADIACTGSIGEFDPVAVVVMTKGSGSNAVLRDYADP